MRSFGYTNVFNKVIGSEDILKGLIQESWANYINGDLTPLVVPANTPTKLTLNANSGIVDERFLNSNVSTLWNSTTNQFDFSSLEIGDTVEVRIDGLLTTTTLNDSFSVVLVGALGSTKEYELPFASGNRFVAGSSGVSRYNSFFIGSEEVRDYPSEIRALCNEEANGYLIDIFIKVNKRVN